MHDTQTNDKATIANNWKTPGATVSGRYMYARFQASPRESHHKAVKHILRYLVHTPKLGLWYPKDAKFDLIGYTDADWAGDKWIASPRPVHVSFLDAPW